MIKSINEVKDPRFLTIKKEFIMTGDELVFEASDLGLPPLEFPVRVKVEGYEKPFYWTVNDTCDGGEDLAGVNYEDADGKKLLIIND